ncbi:hypothetical protein D3C77_516560 [compost metagenome]
MKLETQPFTITRPIIIEGKMDMSLLQEMGKDPGWLHAKIAPTNANVRDVILATITGSENLRVYVEPRKDNTRD